MAEVKTRRQSKASPADEVETSSLLWRFTLAGVVAYAVIIHLTGLLYGVVPGSDFAGFVVSVIIGSAAQAVAFNVRFFRPAYDPDIKENTVRRGFLFGIPFTVIRNIQRLNTKEIFLLLARVCATLAGTVALLQSVGAFFSGQGGTPLLTQAAAIALMLIHVQRWLWVAAVVSMLSLISYGMPPAGGHLFKASYVAWIFLETAALICVVAGITFRRSADIIRRPVDIRHVWRTLHRHSLIPLMAAFASYWLVNQIDRRPELSNPHRARENANRSSILAGIARSAGDSGARRNGSGGQGGTKGQGSGGRQEIGKVGEGTGRGTGYDGVVDGQRLRQVAEKGENKGSAPDGGNPPPDRNSDAGSPGQGQNGDSSDGQGDAAGNSTGGRNVESGSNSSAHGGDSGPDYVKNPQAAASPERRPWAFNPPRFQVKPAVAKAILAFVALLLAIFWFMRTGMHPGRSDKVPAGSGELDPHVASRRLEASLQALKEKLRSLGEGGQVSRAEIVRLYNDLLALNDANGLKRAPNMTPDEYQLHYISNAPRRADAIKTVTRVYSLVFYGNRRADAQTAEVYCRAIMAAVFR